jgi:hypothetical protein
MREFVRRNHIAHETWGAVLHNADDKSVASARLAASAERDSHHGLLGNQSSGNNVSDLAPTPPPQPTLKYRVRYVVVDPGLWWYSRY